MKYFKFYSNRNRNFNSVKNFELYASLCEEFNDPFEGLVQNDRKEMTSRVCEAVKQLRTRRAVVCLAHAETNDFVRESIQMWANYSSHEGFCVEYNDKILDTFKPFKDMGRNIRMNETEDVFMDVEYGEFYPVQEIDLPDWHVTALGHKERKWEYEQETRLIVRFPPINNSNRRLSKKGNGIHIPIPEKSVEAIYLGLKASKFRYATLVKFAREHNIPCYRMRLSHQSYKLDLEREV